MNKTKMLKRTQIDGTKYDLPAEEVELEKLLRKGLTLAGKVAQLTSQLDQIKNQLIALARIRREGSTTTNLKGITGTASVTFRESYICDDRITEIKHELGSLFDRFFEKKEGWKTTKDLKEFLEADHALGLEDSEEIKTLIGSYVEKKETKPHVKLIPN